MVKPRSRALELNNWFAYYDPCTLSRVCNEIVASGKGLNLVKMHLMQFGQAVVCAYLWSMQIALWGNVSAPGARRASFVTRALPVDCCR